jgi:hypothetical protein
LFFLVSHRSTSQHWIIIGPAINHFVAERCIAGK